MKIHYDDKVDALYLELGNQNADGVIEIREGINIDTTSEGRLIGIEILDASEKLDINTILSYTLDVDKDLLKGKIA